MLIIINLDFLQSNVRKQSGSDCKPLTVSISTIFKSGFLEINLVKSIYFILINISRYFLVLLLFEFFIFLYLTILGKSNGPNSKIPSLI